MRDGAREKRGARPEVDGQRQREQDPVAPGERGSRPSRRRRPAGSGPPPRRYEEGRSASRAPPRRPGRRRPSRRPASRRSRCRGRPRSAGGGSRLRPRTSARAVARLTDASSTPGTAESAFSIVLTQEAQCMPWIESVRPGASEGGRGGAGGAALPPCTGSAAGDFAGGAEAGERRAMPKAYRGRARVRARVRVLPRRRLRPLERQPSLSRHGRVHRHAVSRLAGPEERRAHRPGGLAAGADAPGGRARPRRGRGPDGRRGARGRPGRPLRPSTAARSRDRPRRGQRRSAGGRARARRSSWPRRTFTPLRRTPEGISLPLEPGRGDPAARRPVRRAPLAARGLRADARGRRMPAGPARLLASSPCDCRGASPASATSRASTIAEEGAELRALFRGRRLSARHGALDRGVLADVARGRVPAGRTAELLRTGDRGSSRRRRPRGA